MSTSKYETEALRLIAAIEIAIDAFEKCRPPGWTDQNAKHMIGVYSLWKNDLFHPEDRYRNLTTLKQQINDAFTYFQEANGPTVDLFWQQIRAKGLGYERENRLAKILKRKKIKDAMEYDLVIDTMVPNYQEGSITKEEYDLLSEYVGRFESKRRR